MHGSLVRGRRAQTLRRGRSSLESRTLLLHTFAACLTRFLTTFDIPLAGQSIRWRWIERAGTELAVAAASSPGSSSSSSCSSSALQAEHDSVNPAPVASCNRN